MSMKLQFRLLERVDINSRGCLDRATHEIRRVWYSADHYFCLYSGLTHMCKRETIVLAPFLRQDESYRKEDRKGWDGESTTITTVS